MREKKDQLQAHLFIVGRLVKALVQAEPDLVRTPLRRTTTGWVWGLVFGTLISLVFLVIGFVKQSSTDKWRVAGAIVVEKETGARFVYLPGADGNGQLRAAPNLTSAKLAAAAVASGAKDLPPFTVSAKTLNSPPKGQSSPVPRGPALGSVGPESLPKDLQAGPWSLCVPTTGPTGKLVVSLPAAPAEPVPATSGLLVRSGQDTYLLWNGRRYAVIGPVAMSALGAGSAQPFEVPRAFVESLPAGKDFAPQRVPEVGKPGPVVDGQRLRSGQVTHAASGEYFIVFDDGLLSVPQTEAQLALGDPLNAPAYPGKRPKLVEITAAGAASAKPSGRQSQAENWPRTPPQLVAAGPARDTQPCAQLTISPKGDATASFGIGRGTPPVVGTSVGQAVVRPGSGALIGTTAKPKDPNARPEDGPAWLLADDGRKYPLTDRDAKGILGLEGLPVRLPPVLLDAIPTGSALTMQAALSPGEPAAPGAPGAAPTDPGAVKPAP
jgi:type VII secretion protein EccB